MNTTISDAELGQTLRAKAASLGYTPEDLLALAADAAERQRWAVAVKDAPAAQMICHDTVRPEHLSAWPDWCARLIPLGTRYEHLIWDEDTMVFRLLSPTGTLMAVEVDRLHDPQRGAAATQDTGASTGIEAEPDIFA